jgi:indole-3-glycerol phosphate synthase
MGASDRPVSPHDYLAPILGRKRAEVDRRHRHASWFARLADATPIEVDRGRAAVQRLRRPTGAAAGVIAEIKFRSPSAGTIRPRHPGDVADLAAGYTHGGAVAVSVLSDGPGFGGSVLDVRRAAAVSGAPVLFKEFVLDPVQIQVARLAGASLVLLLVRALEPSELVRLVAASRAEGLEPVVEAADRGELEQAVDSGATVVGVNARDLRSFRVDRDAAARCVEAIPQDRVAVLMSGIGSGEDFRRASASRADAVLVGEGLMRAPDPGARLRAWITGGNET